MKMRLVAASLAALVAVLPASAQAPEERGRATRATKIAKKASFNHRKEMERVGYKKMSSLVSVPEFLPGLGVLYVKPDTLPVGPYLAYDRKDRLVSTIYMVPMEDLANQKKLDLKAVRARVDHVSIYHNSGHAGAAMPHYHIVNWHVDKKGEARVARDDKATDDTDLGIAY